MIPSTESLTVEIKSDRRGLSDRELVETVVCLANTEGGTLYLGVEDDGTPTGLHRRHLDVDGVPVARVETPKARQIVATTDGVTRRRRLRLDGTPECVPFLPHEFAQRLAELGVADPSAQPVPGATLDDFDPAERARLRQFIERFHGDRALLELSDEELDGALGLTARQGDGHVPTLAGPLLIGRESSLRDLVPAHEVAFQVLDGEDIRYNEFTRAPLLRTFEWLETSFGPLNAEHTLSASVYRQSGRPAEYIRQAGFDRLQQEQMVRAYVREHGQIRRRDVVELCGVSADQAKRLLARLVDEGALTREGTGKATRYLPGEDG